MKRSLGVILVLSLMLNACIFGRPGAASRKVMSYRDGHVFLTGSRNDYYNVGLLPGGWDRMRLRAYTIAFHNEDMGATISTDAFCGSLYEDVPLPTLTSQLFGGVEDFEITKTYEFTLNERGALRTIAKGTLDGVPLNFDIVVLKKNKCMFDFICVAPDDNETDIMTITSDFEQFFNGFQYNNTVPY